jgi:hypothetical protein
VAGFEKGSAMQKIRSRVFVAALIASLVGVAAYRPPVRAAADTLPQRLSDQEFWKLSEELSEPDGFFRSDNLLSNEIYYPSILSDLIQRTKPGGVYLGVGPEQNFNYITAIKPKIVFITDVRRGNLHTQLMYKALFELSKDRADFFGRLFTKKRPEGLTDKSTAADIVNAYWNVPTSSEEVYKENVRAIRDLLTKKHNIPIKESDLQMIADNVYWYFYWYGPSINYNSSSNSGGRGNMVDYGSLMMAQDAQGGFRSYLASEESFRYLKDLEERNLIVPVIGNFGGPKALRAVGKYVRDHGATVTAFYLSNVEQYLRQDGIWNAFCGNVASMPLDASSTFIRSASGGGGGMGGGLVNYLGSMQDETRGCSAPGAMPHPAR